MIYYSVEVLYNGPKCGIEPDEAQSNALMEAEKQINKLMDDAGVQWYPSYAWPDGSLYYYVRTEKTEQELRQIYNDNVRIADARIIESTRLIWDWKDDSPTVQDKIEEKYAKKAELLAEKKA